MTDQQWQVAWKLYQSCGSIAPENLPSFLNEATDDALIRDAVRGLLDRNNKVESLDRIGQKVGRYILTGRLGAGGMGEVYAARDSELGRSVAVKLLARAPDGASSPVARFIHEAKAASALNHPNIVTIYEVIHTESRLAIVMELVDGMPIRQWCGSSVPVDRVLHWGEQIARALAAAHARGIVHCDIKPENLMVRQDGIVKVLDFGLARDLGSITSHSVGAGGTLRYMSPEQSRSEPTVAASDVFSLGIVLYELAAGVHPFESSSLFDSLKALNQADPPAPSSLNSFLPVHLDRLILAMLAKEPDRRPSAAEVARVLGSGLRVELAPVAAGETVVKKPIRQLGSNRAWIATALFAGIALSTWAYLSTPWRGTPSIERPSMHLDLDLGPGVSLGSSTGPTVILSPNGERVVFVSRDTAGVHRLFTRRLDKSNVAPLPGTEGAYAPFFSPDGQWVGFFAQAKLKKIRVDGGEPITLCEAPSGRGASWAEDGTIIAALDVSAGLSQIPAEGGTPVAMTRLRTESGESTHRWPQALPGSKAVLFSSGFAYSNWSDATILAMSLPDRKIKTVIEHGGMYPRYLPSGHLVYVTKGTLFAVPFDRDRLEVKGAPLPLADVAGNANYGFAQFDFSRNGAFVWRSGGSQGLRTLQWVNTAGKAVSFGLEPSSYMIPRLSPDGRQVAYIVSQGASTDLWVYDFERSIPARLTNGSRAYNPVWSPDGRFLVFQTPEDLSWLRADGAGKPEPLTHRKAVQSPSCFSPDGTLLAYSEQIPEGGAEIRTMAVNETSGKLHAGEPNVFIKTSAFLTYPSFSPDGHWLAYADAEDGAYEVYVRAFPDNGSKVRISNAGGTMPLWSRTANELYYRTADQRIMVADYAIDAGRFRPGKPRQWFDKPLASLGLAINFDLAPDGKRFIALMPAESPEPQETRSHVMIATDFFDEVQRRLAGKKDQGFP